MPQITQLDNDPTPNNNDLLVTVDMAAGTTKNISREQFFTGAPLPAGTVNEQAIAFTPQTAANTGSAGGTWTYWSYGGVKFAAILSNAISYADRGNSGFTYPSGFFNSIISVTATSSNQTNDARAYANVSSATNVSTTTGRWYNPNSTETNQTSRINLFVIGT